MRTRTAKVCGQPGIRVNICKEKRCVGRDLEIGRAKEVLELVKFTVIAVDREFLLQPYLGNPQDTHTADKRKKQESGKPFLLVKNSK
jgi:hypothetical protein